MVRERWEDGGGNREASRGCREEEGGKREWKRRAVQWEQLGGKRVMEKSGR